MEVWDFLDPQQANQAPTHLRPPNFNTYDVTVTMIIPVIEDAPATQTIVTQKIIAISELFITQREDYKEEYTTYKINKSYVNQINKGIITVKLTMMKSAKDFIPTSYHLKSAKKIFIFLIKYFKLPD